MRSKFKWIFTLIVAFTVQFSFAQTVSGVVTDDSGPVVGANVFVKGAAGRSTQTNVDGKYTIKANNGETLVFSYVGSESLEKKVNGSTVNAKLTSGKATVIEDVVVGAMGIKRPKDAVTSTVSKIGNSDLTAASNPDAVRALVGKVSGLQINGTSNGVSGSNSIRVRSMVSLTGNTEALVVIDDVISTADAFSSLPPDVIQDVTVLKGAQGAALYGSQGKSGVVIVSTKKGSKAERLAVSFNSTVDMESINFVPERQQKYGQGWYGAWDEQENGGWGELFDGSIRTVGFKPLDPAYPQISAPYSPLGDKAIKEFYTTGYIFQNAVNINAGGKDSYLNLNLSNLRRNFILPGDNVNRNNVVLTTGKKFNKFNVGGTFSLTNQRTKQANVNAETTRSDYTLMTNLLQTASNVPVGLFKDRQLNGWNGYYQNPYWARDNNRLVETKNIINLGLNLGYEINKNITLKHTGSIQFSNTDQDSYVNAGFTPDAVDDGVNHFAVFGDLGNTSEFFRSKFGRTYYYGDFIANFNYDLSDKLGMNLNIGQNFQYDMRGRISQGGTNLEIPGLYHINNVLNPALPSGLSNRTTLQKITATFANVDFDYNKYLYLNLTGRYEGNSVAKKGNQFSFYPSAGISFIPTKAIDALKDSKTLSSSKVYFNFTQIGSLDPVSPHQILNLATSATNFPFPTTGNSYNDLTSITDSNVKPEIYTTKEAGLNLGFLKDRLTLDIAGFVTDTKDLIVNSSVSTATGLFNSQSNVGKLRAKGLEVDLGFMPVKTNNFTWKGRASFSTNETKVLDLGGTDKLVIANSGVSFNGDVSAVVGLPFPYLTGTDWEKDGNGNVIVGSNGSPNPTSTYQNLGRATPKYILGLTNSFNYKGVGLEFTMDYRTGHYFLSQTKYNLTWNGHLVESADFDRDAGFIFSGSVIDDPSTAAVGDYIPNTSVVTGGGYTLTGAANKTQSFYGLASNLGSHNLIDATAFKVREISLSYSISKKYLDKLGLQSLKFSVNARNPFVVLSKENRGYADPEASNQFNASTTNAARGARGTTGNSSLNGIGIIGDGQYPSTRTFGFTLNTTF